jgi:hypothetical protein
MLKAEASKQLGKGEAKLGSLASYCVLPAEQESLAIAWTFSQFGAHRLGARCTLPIENHMHCMQLIISSLFVVLVDIDHTCICMHVHLNICRTFSFAPNGPAPLWMNLFSSVYLYVYVGAGPGLGPLGSWFWSPSFFVFLALFRKILSNTLLTERFQKIDPYLGAIVVGAKVTRHGARVTGAKTLTRGADVAGSWRRDLWRQDLAPL